MYISSKIIFFMKNILLVFFVFLSLNLFAQSFVSPINYVENTINNKKVVSFIKERVKDNAAANGIFDASKISKMEKENWKAFKKLTKVTNTTLLESIIKDYSKNWYYNYSEILTLYNWEEKRQKNPGDI